MQGDRIDDVLISTMINGNYVLGKYSIRIIL